MGHIQHHAIIITARFRDHAPAARREALRIGLACTDIVRSEINGYQTFMVVPDGSKSDWPEDISGDAARTMFINWLRAMRYSDGGSHYEWAEVAYGSDDASATVERHEWSPDEVATPNTEPCERGGCWVRCTCAAIERGPEPDWRPSPEEQHHPDCTATNEPCPCGGAQARPAIIPRSRSAGSAYTRRQAEE